jgi:nucleoside-diphosphate-sugar epimerase
MLARGCEKWSADPNVLIFAAGVSDPHCNNFSEFQREITLMEDWIKKKIAGLTIVYFSTTALEDFKRAGSPYARHKLNMEKLVSSNFRNHLILRLPVIIGPHPNPNIFVSKFTEWIKDGKQFSVQSNVVREVLDIDHLVELLDKMLLEKQFGSYSIDGIPTTPCDVAILLEGIIKKPGLFTQEGITKMEVAELLKKYYIP